ncbi:hypothetical protein GCM10022277_41330 [Litoribacillus peritrichatus]|uniref:Uncharacterized protein n=1 Tax=Litoribacillus peritrichatus TaxID=718191 RepID=A0ABP7NC98_9GAMM
MTYGHNTPIEVSSCLPAKKVRNDRTHKLNRFTTQVLAECSEFLPCSCNGSWVSVAGGHFNRRGKLGTFASLNLSNGDID